MAFFNGVSVPVAEQLKFYDVWGTEQTYNHMSAGWSWMFDAPFSWFKQNASQLGGVNQNMVVSWPVTIKDKGGLREQFLHVIDVVPTILAAAGINALKLWTASSRSRSKARASPTPSTRPTPSAHK